MDPTPVPFPTPVSPIITIEVQAQVLLWAFQIACLFGGPVILFKLGIDLLDQLFTWWIFRRK